MVSGSFKKGTQVSLLVMLGGQQMLSMFGLLSVYLDMKIG